MKKLIIIIVVVAVGYLINLKFVDIAYAMGFAELKKEAILINDQKMKVKCDSYAFGFFDEIKLENKFQQCINDYQAQGYVVLDAVQTDSDA
ncbi:hypothetical protein [Shewanella phaeophyticola]|uniref:DUF4177 domain-containing protein n=1 Tax=Shewanella phaeophyticola TaxID=2978345 RepID=A0ABT2P6C9_9GAMM|nr:hypothetical protein [Shewanella sp. KJ10-1]MCT8986920.1 hypothetical protein [Shewanella sp. KJ10-1]